MGAGIGPMGDTGGGRRRRRRNRPVSEINVTPLVDVMLVLLIVFMVSAPLLTVGVPIDLPNSRAKPMEGDTQPITINIKADGSIVINSDTQVTPDELVTKLQAIAKTGDEEQRIFVRGDKAADYGTIMSVMGRLNEAGFRHIGLVTLGDEGS